MTAKEPQPYIQNDQTEDQMFEEQEHEHDQEEKTREKMTTKKKPCSTVSIFEGALI